ncbi:Putative PQQ-dependent dehydrogenase [Methyloversatilis universalis FAM5]|jgi:alcohol dehydrogenase (cytochrome c)|uniref:PQQ-dependent dehydrogenase n=1 Tax=Methyloversatilis universalis (strain ATCC BAA-1314 / DSM 25237 / JCM 13912 / CCUG 52030 / FAM5) TaxID=1000565 RepID=F5RDF8_METUF|nr:PQQ-dependent dehydrogenase, methanol/ethanol family [Methyloversatilis universalis]EGK70935.1 Putative PQQ-dependent dehydrogenase [Methyloversatilis universalis FAM5]
MNKNSGRTLRPSAVSTLASSLLAALLLAPVVAHAEDPEPPLGINVLEATFKWRPNYVSDDMLINADKDANNWLHYGKDYQATRFSQLRQVTQDNVKKLVPKWNLSFGVNDAQDSQTTVVNGRIYVTASQNKVFSIDGATGRMLWKYERSLPGDLGPRLCCEAVNRGVAVYKDMVYMATLDTHVVALNNTTGKVVWEKKLGDYTTGEIYTSMPLVADGKIVVGNSGGDVGANVGKITALDPDTGEIVWQTTTRPTDAKDPNAKTWANDSWRTGGSSAWLTGNYDPKSNTIYWGVGNPTPDFDPSVRKGDNLYSNSTLMMDARTGKIKNHFQYTPNDAWDYDGNNETILVDDEKGRKVWLHGDRNGHLYSIDRVTGKCNWVVPIARVNWVTGFSDNCRPIVNPEKVPGYDKIAKDIAPILDGGKEWHPAAYSPKTKLLYVPYIDSSMDIQAKKMEWKRGEWFLSSKVLKANPYTGGIKAFNATTGEVVWSRPQSTPATSGMLATAGGVVFAGDAEGWFHAMRDDTGEALWRFNVGTGIHGNPTTFTVDGKQYVAIVYGPGGGSLWPLVYDELFKHQNRGGGMMIFGLSE